MAGSLPRPPFHIWSTCKKCSTSKYKSIIKLQKQHLLHTKESHHQRSDKIRSSHKNQQQLHQLLKRLKYCQSLPLSNLLLLLPSSLLCQFYDSCRTAASENNKSNNRNLTKPAIKCIPQYTEKQQQHRQQPHTQQHHELDIFKKLFKSMKLYNNLLNRQNLEKLQLRDTKLI